jgi:hypothetical protein
MRLVSLLVAGLLLTGCMDDAEPHPTPEEAKRCLERSGLRVLGPTKPAPEGSDAPESELVVGDGRLGAFIAYYESIDAAEDLSPAVRRRTEEIGGFIARYGDITIIYTKEFEKRKALESCVI